jgi:DNA recombination protein RmuC
MTYSLPFVALAILLVILILQFLTLRRQSRRDISRFQMRFDSLRDEVDRADRTVREEIARNRTEATYASKGLREEVSSSLSRLSDSLVNTVGQIGNTQRKQLDGFSSQLATIADADQTHAKHLREELASSLKSLHDSLVSTLADISTALQNQFDSFTSQLASISEGTLSNAKDLRDELHSGLKGFNDSLLKQMSDIANLQKAQLEIFSSRLDKLVESNEGKLELLRATVETKLTQIQADNSQKLDEVKRTVDEQLQGTLEKRLGESFRLVNERLEQVHRGLGEMQTLAVGVGDLKKVFANVKTRGSWGEVQLGALLEQMVTAEQYSANVATKAGGERVEFALRLPGRGDGPGEPVWLPIDAKFPLEDYQRLIDAQEQADMVTVETVGKQLENTVKTCAAAIFDKYLAPPQTTDFGIMFLANEGLFAEVIRRPGLVELVQREYRVVVTGPTTLAALLNALQMGFKTLAIQKRSSEVWAVLGAVKTEFSKFGQVLQVVKDKLDQASHTIDKAQTRRRVIARKLRDVEELPPSEARALMTSTKSVNADDGELAGNTEDSPVGH